MTDSTASLAPATSASAVPSSKSGNVTSMMGRGLSRVQSTWRGMSSFPRSLFARLAGGSFNGSRDFYTAFGWDVRIDNLMLWKMYTRGGIARRIVHAYGNTVWGNHPERKAIGSWTKAWQLLETDHKIWSTLNKLDALTQLGAYAILIVGLKGAGPMDQPISKVASGPDDILYLQPYSSRSAVISRWGTDPTEERFGLPIEYMVYPGLARTEDNMFGTSGVGQPMQIPNQGSFRVHWSRVAHFCQGQLENDVFGVPLLWAVWNYLTDLQKTVGGSAESYWLTANRGMQADVDKDMELSAEDEAALADEIDEYVDGMRRFVRTRGVKMTPLGEGVADPKGPFDVQITLVSGTTGIPKRILLGSEAAHNASTQDKGTWAERIIEYRRLVAEPAFLTPLDRMLMRIGVLPTVKLGKIINTWPDAYQGSPLEQAQESNQWATAANNLAMAVSKVPNMMTVEELRAKGLGMPDDGKIVAGTKADPPAVNPDTLGGPGSAEGDGGTSTGGNGSGDGSSDSPNSDGNGKGAPVAGRK